jgi:hypothetical protein
LPSRAGQPRRTDLPRQPALPPRAGQPQQPAVPAQPAAPAARPELPNRFGAPGLQRPAVQRPGQPAAPRRAPPAPQRGKKDKR